MNFLERKCLCPSEETFLVLGCGSKPPRSSVVHHIEGPFDMLQSAGVGVAKTRKVLGVEGVDTLSKGWAFRKQIFRCL